MAPTVFVFEAESDLLVFKLRPADKVDRFVVLLVIGVVVGKIFRRFTEKGLAPSEVFDVF